MLCNTADLTRPLPSERMPLCFCIPEDDKGQPFRSLPALWLPAQSLLGLVNRSQCDPLPHEERRVLSACMRKANLLPLFRLGYVKELGGAMGGEGRVRTGLLQLMTGRRPLLLSPTPFPTSIMVISVLVQSGAAVSIPCPLPVGKNAPIFTVKQHYLPASPSRLAHPCFKQGRPPENAAASHIV